MILVDTSVLVDIIRTGDPKLIGLLRQHNGSVCGVVLNCFIRFGTKRGQSEATGSSAENGMVG